MKKFRKTSTWMSLLLVCLLMAGLLVGCGGSKAAEETAASPAASENNEGKTDASATAATENKTEKAGKKIVILDDVKPEKESDMNYTYVDNIKATLKEAGFSAEKNEFTVLYTGNDASKCPAIVEQIKTLKPDVVVSVSSSTALNEVVNNLNGSGIAILTSNVDFIKANNENGTAKANISGITAFAKDSLKGAYQMLNLLSPLNGKKAVFLNTSAKTKSFTKEAIENALSQNNLVLKEYVNTLDLESFEEAIKKYNSDNEVGWILWGASPAVKKNGSPVSKSDGCQTWANLSNKPSATITDFYVSNGVTCGMAIDINENIKLLAKMAGKVLDGEDINNIKREEPAKTVLLINKKHADKIGLKIPQDILTSAWRVYTDYNGTYLGQK